MIGNTSLEVTSSIISKLYSLYDGILRFILNSLSTAFKELVRDSPIILDQDSLIKVLSETGKKRWLNKLTDVEQEVLFLILKKGEINNKEIAKKLKKQKQNISKVTNKLLDLCAIKVKKFEGKEKFFTVEHSIKWFLLEDKKKDQAKEDYGKEIQVVLNKFLK